MDGLLVGILIVLIAVYVVYRLFRRYVCLSRTEYYASYKAGLIEGFIARGVDVEAMEREKPGLIDAFVAEKATGEWFVDMGRV